MSEKLFRAAANMRTGDRWRENGVLVRLVGIRSHTIGSMVCLDVAREDGSPMTLTLYRENKRLLEPNH